MVMQIKLAVVVVVVVVVYSAILVLLHPTSGYSEIQFDFEIHSEVAEIYVSGIINRQNK